MSKEETKKKNTTPDITPTKKKILKKGVSSEEDNTENEKEKEAKESEIKDDKEKNNKSNNNNISKISKIKKKGKKGRGKKKRGRKKKDDDDDEEDEDEEFAEEEKIDITKEDKSEDKTDDKTEDKKEEKVEKIEIESGGDKSKENSEEIKDKENKEKNKENKENKDKENKEKNNDNTKDDKENNNMEIEKEEKKEENNDKKEKKENNNKENKEEKEINEDNNKIIIEEDPEEEANKRRIIQRRKNGRRRQIEERKKEELEQRTRDEKEKLLLEDDDIISIHEEEEKIMNSNYEMKSDNNKYLNTPFGKLLQISQEYGFGTVMDKLISFINTNEPNTKYGVVGISKDLKDILKKLNKETLNLYLIKLLAYNQKKNFRILNEFKMLNDKKFTKYIKKIREGDGDLGDGDINFDDDESFNTEDDKEKINSEDEDKKEDKDKVDRRRGTDLHDDVQYRSRHFQWKDGILHSYLPKINLKSMRCYLYCWKMGCRAKVRIDMINKTGIMYGTHTDHRGVILENFKDEYPELDTDGWEHIQYDVKNGKKILMWKN